MQLRRESGADLRQVDLRYSTNARTHEAPVVLDADLTTSEKIRYGCDRLFGAPSAGTYCQDEITERKFGARL